MSDRLIAPGCLSDEAAAALVEGCASTSERAAAEHHLATCVGCRRLVSELIHLEGVAPDLRASVMPAPLDDSGELAAGTPRPAGAVLSAGDSVGRYVIQHQLGAGGMGIVYAGYDPELDRRIAIKILRPELLEAVGGAQSRLRAEARAMARLHHPNVVQVHDVGVDGEQVYIAMEYIDGEDLATFSARHRAAGDWRPILRACIEAGQGLAAAHAAGLVHRDFKPSNVLCARDGRVVVVDFGLTRIDVAAVAQAGPSLSTAAGTAAYAAPEQVAGIASDARSDQFSFCVTMRECLLGNQPGAPDASPRSPTLPSSVTPGAERVIAVDAGTVSPPSSARVPASIRIAIARGASRERDARFPSMMVLIGVLARDAQRRPWRRARVAIALASAMLAGFAVAVYATSGGASGASREVDGVAVPATRMLVQDLAMDETPYGADDTRARAIADVLSILLRDYPSISPTGPQPVIESDWRVVDRIDPLDPQRAERWDRWWSAAARRLGVAYRVRGTFAERDDSVTITLGIVDVRTGETVHAITKTGPVGETAQLMRELASWIAQQVRPGALAHSTLAPEVRARELIERGTRYMSQRRWLAARPYFEQAVEVDPDLFEAWRAVASIYAWTLAPEPVLAHAMERASALAPQAGTKQLWRGASQYLHGEFGQAVVTLSALEAGDLEADRGELDYYLGEALYHDGRYAEGVAHLVRLLETFDPRQRAGSESTVWPVAVHLGEYALGHRDLEGAIQYLLLQKQSLGPVKLARGEYEALAKSDDRPFSGYAALVLERPPSAVDELTLRNEPGYAIALAAGAGDLAAARRELARWWEKVRAQPPSVHWSYEVGLALEVLIAAGMADEARQVIEVARERATGRAIGTVLRASILLAPLIGSPKTFPRDGMTTRTARLATAIEAELAGDRARAVALLSELVGDPGPSWDYPERVALARNLHALGRTRELRERCADLSHPAVFRLAFLPARHACRQLLGTVP